MVQGQTIETIAKKPLQSRWLQVLVDGLLRATSSTVIVETHHHVNVALAMLWSSPARRFFASSANVAAKRMSVHVQKVMGFESGEKMSPMSW